MISRTNIEEANKHLNALTKKIQQLEFTVQDQHDALLTKDAFLACSVEEITSAKDSEITQLSDKLAATEDTVKLLKEHLKQKDRRLKDLEDKCHILDGILLFQPSIQSLCESMKLALERDENEVPQAKDSKSTIVNSLSSDLKHNFVKESPIHINTDSLANLPVNLRNSVRKKKFSISEDDDGDDERESDFDENLTGKEFYL